MLADPIAYLDKPTYMGHLYAIQLLGHFQEVRAHDVIVDLASLPPGIPHDLFGDTITEDLASIMFATCGGSIERIKALLLNREADEYCRSAASRALVYAAVEGVVPREQILALFGSLFNGSEADSDSAFWSFVASSVCDLYPEELMSVVKHAFADGLIDTDFIGPESFERALRQGQERCLREVRDRLKRYMPDDFHDRMAWWACFRQEPKAPRSSLSPAKTSSDFTDVPARRAPPPQAVRKLGRNDPCWCGSGKKYKRCHWEEDRRGR
jgi:hypothetical protein